MTRVLTGTCVNYDTVPLLRLEFEEPQTAIGALHNTGIKISKRISVPR